MKTVHSWLPLGAAWLLSLFVLSSAQAQEYSWGPWAGWWPYGSSYSLYRSGEIPTPPYFAIHPPVYYGRRVGMPYGNSPLTRLPGRFVEVEHRWRSASDVRPAGVMISNPFVVTKGNASAEAQSAVTPQTILNPHVEQPAMAKEGR